MKINHVHHMRKGFSLVELLVVIAIIAALAGVSYGPIMNKMRAADQIKAVTNAKNINTALVSFAGSNDGLYPNEDTANSTESGDTAEGCFTQVMNTGDIEDEMVFWNNANIAAGTVTAARPNNDGILTSGENAWGYVSGLSTSSSTRTPIIFDASAEPGVFNTGVWNGKAIVAKLDGSATAMDIAYGGGKPTNDDGTPKTGPIEEKRGESNIDIFDPQNLPKGAEVLVPN